MPRRSDPVRPARSGRLRGTYVTALRERAVIFDGATGTNLSSSMELRTRTTSAVPTSRRMQRDSWWSRGPTRSNDSHRSFLDVGVDVIETDTFGASSVVLAEYGLIMTERFELNLAAAQLARRVADGYASPDRPRWVAGSMGPGTKFPTLGPNPLRRTYATPTRSRPLGLLEGGVDLLIIETVFDLLSGKAAINGAKQAMVAVGRRVPLQVQVTIELTGRMLPGTEIAAALAALDAMAIDVIGLNCATGPTEMGGSRSATSRPHSRVPLSCAAATPAASLGRRRPHALRPDPRTAGGPPPPLRDRAWE